MVLAPPPEATGIRVHGLPSGVPAPPLDLPATPDGRRLSLSAFAGAPLVIVFYPADFTPVCAGEIGLFNELLPEIGRLGARVVGISVDSISTHTAFAEELHVQIPLLADFHPKGEVARRYNVYREEEGFSERALFVVDGGGVIFWSHVSPIELNPGAAGVLDALERLTGKSLEEAEASSPLAAPDAEARP
ncbi:MAG: redoxin domain-containing protein [Deltaproteobacteria bacterium]|nr:redoxin domain-containing protein [Deltaproteobacteria bacterium]